MTQERPIRTAAIVAAGFGSRLNELTAAMPKGFLEIGGQSLVERSLDTLRSFGVERVVIGTGFQAHFYDLAERRGDVVTVLSEQYATTSSMVTLWNLRHALRGRSSCSSRTSSTSRAPSPSSSLTPRRT